MKAQDDRPRRLPGCESTNHTLCYGELWQCSQCGKTVCNAEGSDDDDPDLCDDCWYDKHKNDPDIRLVEDAAKRSHPRPTTPVPDLDTIAFWMWDGVAEAADGCQTEPDGTCPHGHRSWLIELGLI